MIISDQRTPSCLLQTTFMTYLSPSRTSSSVRFLRAHLPTRSTWGQTAAPSDGALLLERANMALDVILTCAGHHRTRW
ncbi:hypothetical protein PsYK624_052640 [Phanerochaete sordida]|uniref:Uncharacterized protein n=1 Tax=Phanerochaete sordida TaxID=48140 RepID=A0A9P3LC38_9APHY|nr:hypothetical protein PsYK624_052640 [Phanerochaete sordida]